MGRRAALPADSPGIEWLHLRAYFPAAAQPQPGSQPKGRSSSTLCVEKLRGARLGDDRGVPVSPSTSYRVTVNSFLADGGDTFTVLVDGTNRLGGQWIPMRWKPT